jgi:ribonuclease P protein subunit RPR2
MAKDKSRGIPNRHLHSRISYLHQAAQYLANHSGTPQNVNKDGDQPNELSIESTKSRNAGTETAELVSTKGGDDSALRRHAKVSGQALRLSSQLLLVSQRSKVAVSRDIKRLICKCCNELLIPGKTAIHRMENKSKGGRKPWADVLVVECQRCGFQKRYPVGQQRQPKRKDRIGS